MDWVPFATRLAERTANLVQAAVLPVGGGLETLIVEQLLLPVIDTNLQARPEVVVTFLFAVRAGACGWQGSKYTWQHVRVAVHASGIMSCQC